jgi:endoglucanase
MEQTSIELLKRLTEARGISGHEDEIAAILRSELEGHVDRFERDSIKNLFAIKGMDKPGPNVMLNAHMDEVGLYVTRIPRKGTCTSARPAASMTGCCWARRCWSARTAFPA